jgi:hypothetical protein
MKRIHVAAGTALLILGVAIVIWHQGSIDEGTFAPASTQVSLPRDGENGRTSESKDQSGGAAESRTHKQQIGIAVPAEETTEGRVNELERVTHAQAALIEELREKIDTIEQKKNAPSWSAPQVVGAPDSPVGDRPTAWAPFTQDGGPEWLLTEFSKPVEVAQIIVSENCGPGAITRITAVTDSGFEVPLWQGEAPKVVAPSNTPFTAVANVTANRVKIYLDTAKVPGWNEIDAVQLVGRDGSRQWVRSASASSTYGSKPFGLEPLSLGDGRNKTDQKSLPPAKEPTTLTRNFIPAGDR